MPAISFLCPRHNYINRERLHMQHEGYMCYVNPSSSRNKPLHGMNHRRRSKVQAVQRSPLRQSITREGVQSQQVKNRWKVRIRVRELGTGDLSQAWTENSEVKV